MLKPVRFNRWIGFNGAGAGAGAGAYGERSKLGLTTGIAKLNQCFTIS